MKYKLSQCKKVQQTRAAATGCKSPITSKERKDNIWHVYINICSNIGLYRLVSGSYRLILSLSIPVAKKMFPSNQCYVLQSTERFHINKNTISYVVDIQIFDIVFNKMILHVLLVDIIVRGCWLSSIKCCLATVARQNTVHEGSTPENVKCGVVDIYAKFHACITI